VMEKEKNSWIFSLKKNPHEKINLVGRKMKTPSAGKRGGKEGVKKRQNLLAFGDREKGRKAREKKKLRRENIYLCVVWALKFSTRKIGQLIRN